MKSLSDYYNASRKNKIKVWVAAFLIYLLIYISAYPYIFNSYVIKYRSYVSTVTQKINNKKVAPTPSSVKNTPIPIPTVQMGNGIDYVPSE
jgi:hypothetical protein